MLPPPPRSTLFPYTTLFRSSKRISPRGVAILSMTPLQTSMQAAQPMHSYRSEEHTSELQSLRHLVCRLLLEKKKKNEKKTSTKHRKQDIAKRNVLQDSKKVW